MTRTALRLASTSLFVLALALAGCSSDDAGTLGAGGELSGTQTLDTVDLDQEFGGLSFTDEDAAFGDDDLLTLSELEDAAALSVDDEDSLTDEDPGLGSPMMKHTFLRILWGQLDGAMDRESDPETLALLDWSGSIKVSAGAIALKRTILFERPFDHRLPRDSRDSLAWVSHTGPHFDGILVKIISPVVDGVAQGEVTFSTPQYEVTLSVSELDDYALVVEIDEDGNAVSLQGQVFEPTRCAMGFVNGAWVRGEDRPETDAIERGRFRGRVTAQNGMAIGYLSGTYGVSSAGENVLIGKYIGRNGRLMGLVAGTWEPAEDGSVGSFQARWVSRARMTMGQLEGRYRANGDDRIGDGFFEGRWRERCADAAS